MGLYSPKGGSPEVPQVRSRGMWGMGAKVLRVSRGVLPPAQLPPPSEGLAGQGLLWALRRSESYLLLIKNDDIIC